MLLMSWIRVTTIISPTMDDEAHRALLWQSDTNPMDRAQGVGRHVQT